MLVIALLMLITSVLSTETVEVWSRVAVGSTADMDDDDGPYVSNQPASAGTHALDASTSAVAAKAAVQEGDRTLARPRDFQWTASTIDVAVAPAPVTPFAVPTSTVSYNVDTRGPPTRPDLDHGPSPRAPPLS